MFNQGNCIQNLINNIYISKSCYNNQMGRSSGMFGTGIDLNSLQSQEDVNAATDPIIEALYDQNGAKYKQQANKFFDIVLAHLDDGNVAVVSKFYTIMILVQMTEKGQTKILSALSGHPLLGFLANFVDITDPRKPVTQKGRQIFPQDPDSGNNFVRISLECIKFWGQKFLKTRNNQPTKFRRALNTLIQKKVVFPEEYIYFKKAPRSESKTPIESAQPKVEKVEYPQQSQSRMQKMSKPMAQLMFTNNQIDGLVSSLQNAQEAQDLERNIITYHDKFSKDLQKYKKMQTDVFSADPYDQQLVNKYLKIMQFLNQEEDTHSTFVGKGDYISYKDSVLMSYQKIFTDGKDRASRSNFASGNKLMVQKQDQIPKFKSTSSQLIPTRKQVSSEQIIKRENLHQQGNTQSVIKSMFKNMQERSKSPGFKGLKQSLEKQKKKINTNPPRISRISPNNINKSQAKSLSKSKSGNLRQSKVAAIFSNPPNTTNLRDKIYDGKLVLQNNELNTALYELRKQQGMRRFKVSNFRQKNPLFENDVLQIGFKSQTVYQQVQSFKGILALELFIGNKTDSQIRNFKIDYKLDNNQLLYAHPRVVDTIIPAGFQNKHELMFIPLEIPFKLAVAKVQYDYQGQQFRTTIVLPNSILKFTDYRSISKGQLNASWAKDSTFRTVPFPLSQHLPPDGLSKWIPNLEELTRYSEFAEMDSQTDYELYCGVRIKQIYQGILKINVRPNLKVVLQVCNLDRYEQSDKYFKFYLETLQLIMSHTQM